MNYTHIYCDGGPSKWGFIVVQKNKILKVMIGEISGTNDTTECEAVFQAINYAKRIRDNYVIYTDSKSVINKCKGTWADHTGNKKFQGIRNELERFQNSQWAESCALKYKRRCSDKFSKEVDLLVSG